MLTLNDQNVKKKKQKLVKHRRKNWSKTDIADVEQGIDDLRHQELTGGVRAEKKDEELFYISKTKLPEDAEDQPPAKRKKLSFEEKLKNLKCYKALEPDPISAPVHIHEVRQDPDVDSRTQAKKREILARKAKKFLKHKQLPDPEAVVDKKERKFNKHLETDFEKDLWTSSDLPEITDVNEYYLKQTKKLLPKRPERLNKKPSALPSVPAPHPGMSYNPDYDDHQDLLLKAHEAELKKLEAEQKLMKKFSSNIKKLSWQEIEDLWLEEMAVKDLFDKNDESEEEDAAEAAEKKAEISISKRQLKKKLKGERVKETKAQRQKRRLLEKVKKREKENEKKIRIQQNEIYRLKSIVKEINTEVKSHEEKLLQREIEAKHRELFEPKRLNSLKYEEPELEVKLSDEITGNLRTLKPEGNIMLDRYKNLQKRNIIEPRERLTRAKRTRQYTKKKFDKRNAHEKTYYIK